MISRTSLLVAVLLTLLAAGRGMAQGGALEFDSATVSFGSVPGDSCYTVTLVLRNSIPETINDIQIVTTNPFVVTVSPQRIDSLLFRQSTTIVLRWCDSLLPCLDTAFIHVVATGQSIDTTQTITYTDSAQILGCVDNSVPVVDSLWVSRPSLPFGFAYLPDCVDDTLTVHYTGSARTISLDIQPAGDFTIVSPQVNQQIRFLGDSSLVVTVRYCPDSLGVDAAMLRVMEIDTQPARITSIPLSGTPRSPWTLGGVIDVGQVPVDSCDSIVVPVVGQGQRMLQIDDVVRQVGPFTLRFSDSLFRPGDTLALTITFCPTDSSVATEPFVVGEQLGTNQPYGWFTVTGRGVAPPTDTTSEPTLLLWIDTATARVGERAELFVRTSRPLAFNIITDTLQLRLGYPRSSLVLESIESASTGWSLDYTHVGDSSVLISLLPGRAAPTTSTLARIGFTGLTTGVPVNGLLLGVESGLSGPVETFDGLLLLEGCALGVDPRMSRRAAINGLRLEPGGETLRLDYRAPLNARVTLRISDVAGTSVQVVELPSGTDAEATAQVPIDGVAPGLAVVELRAGDARAVTLVMVR